LRELCDKASGLNQLSAAINAERLRGELRRFQVKEIARGDAEDFARAGFVQKRWSPRPTVIGSIFLNALARR